MFRKAVHIILTAILVISTTGFTVSRHYCGSHYKSFAIDREAKSCCANPCSACHNVNDFHQLKVNFNGISVSADITPVDFFETGFQLYSDQELYNFTNFTGEIPTLSDCSPPLLSEGLRPLIQVWRL